MNLPLDPSWQTALASEWSQGYFARLMDFIETAYATETVYPPKELVFHAFNRTPFDKVRVVILGQDPYHEPGEAQGLAFYVPSTVPTPPSLANIAKELGHMPNLLDWADQGVLLLNATLTVAAHKAGSHQKRGWETFTDAVVRTLAARREHLVFILWGAYAQRKGALIDRTRHGVIESPHPSPLSAYRGFFGSKPFSRTNDYLAAHHQPAIVW